MNERGLLEQKIRSVISRKYKKASFGSFMGNEGVALLVRELENDLTYSHLKVLCLRNCRFDHEGAVLLGQLLLSDKHLTSLDVGFNKIGNRGVAALAKGLHGSSTLLALEMSEVGLTSEGVGPLINMLSANRSLRKLNLSCNRLFDMFGAQLLEAVVAGKSIRHLSLRMTGLTHACLPRVVGCLIQNHSLNWLNLGDNMFGRDARLFAKVFEVDTGLRDIYLWSRLEEPADESHIAVDLGNALRKNTTLRKLVQPRMSTEELDIFLKLLDGNGSLVTMYGHGFYDLARRNRRMHDAAKRAALTVLAIRWFRYTDLNFIPKDVVKIIAEHVWKSRTCVRLWGRTDLRRDSCSSV